MTLRLVATDLDGTLLHSDGTVAARTREVLTAIEDRGVTVVFVTGRPTRWMDDLWEHVGGHGLAICSNGGVLYDVFTHSVLEARTISPAVGLEVAARIREAFPDVTFALEKTTGFGKEPTFLPHADDANRPELVVGPLSEVFDDQVVKLLALELLEPPEEFWATVDELVGDLVTTTWSTRGALVEMSGLDVTKASTLARLCEARGISPDEVVAFGDMPNDIPMLTWAGTSYAMAGGNPATIAAAGGVAPPNDEDGVAKVLERLFLS